MGAVALALERTPWTSRLLYRKLRQQLDVKMPCGRGPAPQACLPFSRTSGLSSGAGDAGRRSET